MNTKRGITFGTLVKKRNSGLHNFGFTLMELVVVSCLVIVGAIVLLPALANTKSDSKIFQCLNNLKAWSAAQCMSSGENNDNLPTDGMGANRIYGPGSPLPSGTPDDPYAWFNATPMYVGDRNCYSNYYHRPGSDPRTKFPFPGRTNAPQIWHCPAATMSSSDFSALAGGGTYGFFSYTYNIDLKITTNVYPNWMPKLSILPKPAATVLMFDTLFNPATESINGSPAFNSANPANRYRSYGMRHELGPVLSFCDGHSTYYKLSALTNYPGWPASEPLKPDVIWDWKVR